MNKKMKLLSLSFLSSMLIVPIIALSGSIHNTNDTNLIKVANLEEENLLDNFDSEIKSQISELNEQYKNDTADKYQQKYFTDQFNLVQLPFEFKNKQWTVFNEQKADMTLKNGDIIFEHENGTYTYDIMLNNENILWVDPNGHIYAQQFWDGKDGNWFDHSHPKDKNLRLVFSNTTENKETEFSSNYGFGTNKKISSSYSSSFQLRGEKGDAFLKYNGGHEIAYAANSGFLGLGGYDNYLVFKPDGQNEYLNKINPKTFFKGKNGPIFFHNDDPIIRYTENYSKEDNLKLVSFIFDNNYLPNLENAMVIANYDYVFDNQYGKLFKFSDNFKNLKLIGELNKEIKKIIINKDKIINNSYMTNLIDEIIHHLKKGEFNNLEKAISYLISINSEEFDRANKELLDKLELYKIGIIGSSPSFNNEFNELYQVLIENDLVIDNHDLFIESKTNYIGELYEKIIRWLSVNNIKIKINDEWVTVFKDGEIKDNIEDLSIFDNVENGDIDKSFFVNEIQISQANKYDKNIFIDSTNVNNNSSGNNSWDNAKKKFLTSYDYKIAYKKDFKENNVPVVNVSPDRGIPISVLDGYISNYLEFAPNGDARFKDDYIYGSIKQWIIDNIGVNLIYDSYLLSKSKLENLDRYNEIENHKDVLKLLDLEYEDNDEFDQKVIKKLSNENFNDDNGIFYMVAEVPGWNGKEIVLGGSGDKYIGNWKENNQLSFMDSINKDGQTNIIEVEPKDKNKKLGYFILKARTMRTTYTDNLEIYNEIMNNFEKCFTPIIDTYDYEDWDIDQLITKEKIIGYKTIIPDEIIQDIPLLEKMKEVASNSREGIFDYKNIIFNNENRKYKHDTKYELDELSKKIDRIKEVYFQEKEINRKPIYNVNQGKYEFINIGLIFAIVIPIIIIAIIITFIILKILRDEKHIEGK